jgi:hypothetical protein
MRRDEALAVCKIEFETKTGFFYVGKKRPFDCRSDSTGLRGIEPTLMIFEDLARRCEEEHAKRQRVDQSVLDE